VADTSGAGTGTNTGCCPKCGRGTCRLEIRNQWGLYIYPVYGNSVSTLETRCQGLGPQIRDTVTPRCQQIFISASRVCNILALMMVFCGLTELVVICRAVQYTPSDCIGCSSTCNRPVAPGHIYMVITPGMIRQRGSKLLHNKSSY
jgi:hypothetical protein